MYTDVEENVQIEIPLDKNQYIDSRDLAFELGIKHVNMLILIKREETVLLELGEIIEKKEMIAIGRPNKYIMLNKFQAMYLLCITKSTPRVKKLRIDFIKYFYKYIPNI
jgi:phage regulator Rha-like protein